MGEDVTLFGHHVIGKWTNQSECDLTSRGHFDLIGSSRDPKLDQ